MTRGRAQGVILGNAGSGGAHFQATPDGLHELNTSRLALRQEEVEMTCRRPIPAPTTPRGTALPHPGAAPRRVPAGAHRRQPARTRHARPACQKFALVRAPTRGEGATPGPRHVVPGPWTPGDAIRPPGSLAARGRSCRSARAPARRNDALENRMEGVRGRTVPLTRDSSTPKFRGRA